MDFDAIVIGSGFGGAITACRLAEAGHRVLVLERGRRWDKTTYPRDEQDAWIWSQSRPEQRNGWLDLRLFRHMTVVQGAGVGGGSLIYANISCEAPPAVFETGWPKEITFQVLKPYYDRVARFMDVQPVPGNQWNPRMRLMQEAAQRIGHGDRFRQLDLAVSFDPSLNLDPERPPTAAQSRRFVNQHGVEQGYCVHLGNCDIGCDVDAKNTLDKNYLAVAEKHHADVRPLHLATNIEPVSGGYRVHWDRLEACRRIPGRATATRVVVAGGSLNSTELLLRCRDELKSLPRLSRFLGHNWSSNGDFLTPAIYGTRAIRPSLGPTIATAIDFLDRSQGGESFWIEDGGIPNLFDDFLKRKRNTVRGSRAKMLITFLQRLLRDRDPLRGVMPWFAQGADAADGVLRLKRPWWYFGKRRLRLAWDIRRSRSVVDAIVSMHKNLARETGGEVPFNPLWFVCRELVTPHPLGGCNMAETPDRGVVDHAGRVFGYEGLHVADGSIVPEALGVNPSRTIAALAERIAERIVRGE
jgi:cholesterol oxidase